MLQRNLLYTGVTRGKRLVVLVGQKKAVAIAVLSRQQPALGVATAYLLGGRGDELARVPVQYPFHQPARCRRRDFHGSGRRRRGPFSSRLALGCRVQSRG